MTLQAKIPVGVTQKTQRTIYFTLQFIDSYQFLTSSLAKLASNLESLPITERGMVQKYPQADMALLRRKGVFPYVYFDSMERMAETALPPIAEFVNDLDGGKRISEQEYAHAQDAWQPLRVSYVWLLCCTLFGVGRTSAGRCVRDV